MTALIGVCVPVLADEPSSLGDRVLAFCKEHKGKPVGDGECTSLASAALQSAGAKMHGWGERKGNDRTRRSGPRRGEFNWGDLVYVLERDGTEFKHTGELKDVRPGDIIQFSNVELAGAIDDFSNYTLHARHHTAIVSAVRDDGMAIHVYHQNSNGVKRVTATTVRLADLQQGRFSIYHPIPRTRNELGRQPPPDGPEKPADP
jgi:hypothetical protein